MNGHGAASFAQVMAICRRRPGLLIRELAWRWLYGIPALAMIMLACLHIYGKTSGALHAAGIGHISLGSPWQSAAIVAVAMQILRPFLLDTAYWLLPLLGLSWAMAAGIGRNIVFRHYRSELPWRPVVLSLVQGIRILIIAVLIVLWWKSVRWSAAISTVSGSPHLTAYFALVAAITLGFLLIWSIFSWVFTVAPISLLVERQSLSASLLHGLRTGSATRRLMGINVTVAFIRLGLALVATLLSALPFALIPSAQATWLYLWAGAVTILYMAVSGYFQVACVVALVEFCGPVHAPQIQVSQYSA